MAIVDPSSLPMIDRLTHAGVFALYQLTIALGIVMMPVALATKRLGMTLPVHRLVKAVETLYENRTSQTEPR
jgi:hypothetical protein